MNYPLVPFEEDNRVIVHDKGTLPVQLEIPVDSTLTDADIGTILSIASWEDGNITD